MTLVARAVRMATGLVVAVLLLGILLFVLEANGENAIVGAVMDVDRFLADPFRGIFDVSGAKGQVALDFGVAALVYGVAGLLLARVLVRLGAAAFWRRFRVRRRPAA
jgi:hypothetical protein